VAKASLGELDGDEINNHSQLRHDINFEPHLPCVPGCKDPFLSSDELWNMLSYMAWFLHGMVALWTTDISMVMRRSAV
jgi:hypothetical protein